MYGAGIVTKPTYCQLVVSLTNGQVITKSDRRLNTQQFGSDLRQKVEMYDVRQTAINILYIYK